MKKALFTLVFLAASCAGLFAQAFGGWQMPKIEMRYSQKFEDVNYASDSQVYHNMDIYLPKEEKESYPVVIHIYGSAWYSNNSKAVADLGTIVQALLDGGYAVVTPNHRSSSDATFPAQINDIKAVVRFIRANAGTYHLDTSFIATSGFSSGGHLASLAATSGGESDLEGDVGGNLVAIRQADTSDLTKCGVRLLRGGGTNCGADASLLWRRQIGSAVLDGVQTLLQCRSRGLESALFSSFSDQLIKSRHVVLLSFRLR